VSLPSSPPVPSAPSARPVLIGVGLSFAALVAFTALAYGPHILAAAEAARPHAPNLALIWRAPVAIKAHLSAVIAALAIGVFLMTGRKGVLLHRLLGWIWSAFMVTAAASGLFINSAQGFNPIHLFSVFVLWAVPSAVYAARRHNVARHGRTMSGAFWGGLIVAGLFAVLPGRLMWLVFFG
jgi:uncharacterized membrane protein